MKTCVHVFISGRVHGVWFRASTQQKAEQLGLKGWVRNTSDERVEAIFEGDEKQIEQMLKWCQQGPPLADVENVEIEKQNPTDGFDNFSITY